MNLTAEQVKNLNILADFMDGLDAPKFTMSVYTYDCGTPGCALGWACTLPELRSKGLTGWRDGSYKEVFGEDLHHILFSHTLAETIRTPQQWAAHCRTFLKSRGYEVSDGFKTFMERVMIPVDHKELQGETK